MVANSVNIKTIFNYILAIDNLYNIMNNAAGASLQPVLFYMSKHNVLQGYNSSQNKFGCVFCYDGGERYS